LRIKEQETRPNLHEHDDDDDDGVCGCVRVLWNDALRPFGSYHNIRYVVLCSLV